MKNKAFSYLFYGVILLIEVIILSSCSTDDLEQDYTEGTNEYTNEWMYQQMKKYYLWNDAMPNQGDLSVNPKEYFARLVKSDDRFSYAIHPNLPETAPINLRQKFGFDVSFMQYESKVYGVILYALYDSPAKNNGLTRGQLITSVDGVELTVSNYDNIYKNMVTATQLNLKLISYSAQSGFFNAKQVSLMQGFSFSQLLLSQVITNGNTKIGYVEIPHFDVGMAKLFMQTFQELKNKEITEIILDLRYNGGGDIASATALSIILAPNIKSGDLFIEFEGNKNGGIVKQSFQQALESNEKSITFDALRNAHPNIQKVYILCGKHTASASEIIINNLSPFMDVVTIGEKTIGKDVAGFPIEDDRISGTQGWVLYPSIYKLFNSRHEGSYSAGINPSVNADELQNPEVFALGNRSEILLNTAINNISGNTGKMKMIESKALSLSKIYTDADALLVNP
ncbi:S41 family peptidase [Flavobacterium sp. N1736]|uniref:S41 family peptidase n=1 Tax=Flavobacterium sp. N1736 TaxID=2986823 RepID=UPI002225A3B3|nr:S41 family peptidase [Flavobacterium sp. N1736]